ncbi:MAG TPA: ISAs1 family transposase [Chloroflexota bacterium]|nr:ISAs1 family transposase [Chloroflexota bacterium]
MQSTSLPLLLDDLSDDEREALLTHHALRSLADVLATVPDPRSCHGKRYDLPFLLTCLAAALLCNCNSLEAVGQWCREQRPLLRRVFGPRRHLTPTGSLYRWLLPRLSAAHLEWALARWVQATRPSPDTEAVALDGKVLRGAGATEDVSPHLLAVTTHQTHETLIQVPVATKTNEIPVAQALLGWLLVHHRVVTADALHCQTESAQAILDAGGEYLLCLKGNWPAQYAAVVEYFADPCATTTEAVTIERQKGRREERRLRVTTALTDYLAGFPQLAQVAQITRSVTDTRGTHHDVDYFVTSATADPATLLALIRGHWSIERQHWLRDVDFGEDHSRIRSGHAPRVLAALRNAILTLLGRTQHSAIAAARRSFAYHPARALRLVQRSFPLYR